MKKRETYNSQVIAIGYLIAALLCSFFSFEGIPNQFDSSQKRLNQIELVQLNTINKKVGKISFAKSLHFKKRNPTVKRSHWKTSIINYNRQHLASSLAYLAYSLNIELNNNFILFKVIPDNAKDTYPSIC